MSKPFEIIAAPFEVFIAPVGEPFPDVDEAPTGNFVLLGTSGDRNYSEDGVKISHPQSFEFFRFLGTTHPRKANRTEEDMMIEFDLADLTAAQYKFAMNENSITDVAADVGTPGFQFFSLARGLVTAEHALLVRGPSAADDAFNAQYEIPRVIHVGEPEIVFKKDEVAFISMIFQALEDPADPVNLPFGRYVIQDAAALP